MKCFISAYRMFTLNLSHFSCMNDKREFDCFVLCPNIQDKKVSAKSLTQTVYVTALCKNLIGYRELLLSIPLMCNIIVLFFFSVEFRCIKLAQTYPLLVLYLPQLCPYQFFSLVMLPDHKHKNLLSAIEDNPGHLAFKQVRIR